MSSSRKWRQLSEEDRRLWSSVARTVQPIPGRPQNFEPEPEIRQEISPAWPAPPPSPGSTPKAAPDRRTGLQPRPTIDRLTRRKLSKGRIGIDATIDLHAMTQTRAYDALLVFLRRAQANGLRHVLIITGKGTAAGSGVLRAIVPHWLATAPFAALVSSFDTAGRAHGGNGAIYLKLRRPPA